MFSNQNFEIQYFGVFKKWGGGGYELFMDILGGGVIVH